MTSSNQGLTLYHYWRSSCSFRVRIALELKGLEYKSIPINLVEKEEYKEEYAELNTQNIVPTLVTGDGSFTQSLAIIEYLEERYPVPALLPEEPDKRAQVRAFAYAIACDIQPINNLPVLDYLTQKFKATQEELNAWHQHWMIKTFRALEKSAKKNHGTYLFGDTITLADICLVPQIYNAVRFKVELDEFPTLSLVNNNCFLVSAFSRAHPSVFNA